MVKFGTTSLPLVLEVEDRNRKVYVERAIPGKSIAKRTIHGSFGAEFVIRGIITGDVPNQKATLKGLADGVARVLDLEDGSATVTCLMVDPAFRETGKPNQAAYEILFVQSA